MKTTELTALFHSPVAIIITATVCTIAVTFVAVEAHKHLTTGDSKLFS